MQKESSSSVKMPIFDCQNKFYNLKWFNIKMIVLKLQLRCLDKLTVKMDLSESKKNEYLVMLKNMLCVFYIFCFFLSTDSRREGAKSNIAILRRGGFDQRFSKQAASPTRTKGLYASTRAIFTSWLLLLLKQSCRIGNSWAISISARGNVLLSKKCWDAPHVWTVFYKD